MIQLTVYVDIVQIPALDPQNTVEDLAAQGHLAVLVLVLVDLDLVAVALPVVVAPAQALEVFGPGGK